jgi:hypothetical protein
VEIGEGVTGNAQWCIRCQYSHRLE